MYYTNGSTITKTFHGVTFGPGETKEVFGIINDPKFVLASSRKEPPKRVEVESSKSDLVDTPKKKRGRKSAETVVQVPEDVATTEAASHKVSSDENIISVDNHIEEV